MNKDTSAASGISALFMDIGDRSATQTTLASRAAQTQSIHPEGLRMGIVLQMLSALRRSLGISGEWLLQEPCP
jgi:hypothetical protein